MQYRAMDSANMDCEYKIMGMFSDFAVLSAYPWLLSTPGNKDHIGYLLLIYQLWVIILYLRNIFFK